MAIILRYSERFPLKFIAEGYGRLDADGAFATALGIITPDTKGGQVIHPTVTLSHSRPYRSSPDSHPSPVCYSSTALSPSVNSPAHRGFQTTSSFITRPIA